MKRIGCMAVHYGKEYIAWAVKSLAGACDEVHVFYAASPSFGYRDSAAVNPDTEDELVAEANRFAPVTWHRVSAGTEGEHRNQMLVEAERVGGRLVAIADADEIWDPITLQCSLNYVDAMNSAHRWSARFHNFWRSWHWSVLDHFRPIRIFDLRHKTTSDADLDPDVAQQLPIYHFGYAQSVATMMYKISCHGHKAEWKPRWYEDRFLVWDPVSNNADLHPCVNDFWSATRTDDDVIEHLKQLMPTHPYRDLSKIP